MHTEGWPSSSHASAPSGICSFCKSGVLQGTANPARVPDHRAGGDPTEAPRFPNHSSHQQERRPRSKHSKRSRAPGRGCAFNQHLMTRVKVETRDSDGPFVLSSGAHALLCTCFSLLAPTASLGHRVPRGPRARSVPSARRLRTKRLSNEPIYVLVAQGLKWGWKASEPHTPTGSHSRERFKKLLQEKVIRRKTRAPEAGATSRARRSPLPRGRRGRRRGGTRGPGSMAQPRAGLWASARPASAANRRIRPGPQGGTAAAHLSWEGRTRASSSPVTARHAENQAPATRVATETLPPPTPEPEPSSGRDPFPAFRGAAQGAPPSAFPSPPDYPSRPSSAGGKSPAPAFRLSRRRGA